LLPWIKDYPHHTVVFGGDINCDLDAVSLYLIFSIVLLLTMVYLDVIIWAVTNWPIIVKPVLIITSL